jgi:hypothetical protein
MRIVFEHLSDARQALLGPPQPIEIEIPWTLELQIHMGKIRETASASAKRLRELLGSK